MKHDLHPASPSKSSSSLVHNGSYRVRRTSACFTLSPEKSNSISIKDLMGGEKKATDVVGNHSERVSRRSITPLTSEPTVVHAEDKIQNILHGRKTRQRRRSDISRSLNIAAMMLMDGSSDHSTKQKAATPSIDTENLTIPLNDAETSTEMSVEGARRRRRSNRTKSSESPSHPKKSNANRDDRLRVIRSHGNLRSRSKDKPSKKEDKSNSSFLTNAAFSPKSPKMKRISSANALRDRLRQRLQGSNYSNLGESSSDMSTSNTQRVRSKAASVCSDDEDCDLSCDTLTKDAPQAEDSVRSRSKNRRDRRSRSKTRGKALKNQPDSGDGADPVNKGKPRRKSKDRVRPRSKSRRQARQIDTETEEESSITSNSNSGRRGRRPKQLAGDETDETYDADYSCEFSIESSRKTRRCPVVVRNQKLAMGRDKALDTSLSSAGTSEGPIDPPGSKITKKQTKTKSRSKTSQTKAQREPQRDPQREPEEDSQSLGLHLRSEHSTKLSVENDDLTMVSEENSAEAQPILLQFDPTNENLVRSVNQNEAKKTSETIHGLHGTKSMLEISELAGLPTFEKFNPDFPDSSFHSILSTNSSNHSNSSPTTAKNGFMRSTSFQPSSPSHQTAGETPIENDGFHNAQWNFGPSRRGSGSMQARKMLFKKGEKPQSQAKLSSLAAKTNSFGAMGSKTQSFGAMMRLRGRQKAFRDYEDRGMGDGESLLKH